MKAFRNLIWDYGGVISTKSRHALLIDRLLSLCPNSAFQINEYFSSGEIKLLACGELSEDIFLQKLESINQIISPNIVLEIMADICVPNPDIFDLIVRLSDQYSNYLISDSLPAYSRKVCKDFSLIFRKMYFSDILGARKSEGLFFKVIELNPMIFERAIYIDDNAEYVKKASSMGAHGVHFISHDSLIHQLEDLGCFEE